MLGESIEWIKLGETLAPFHPAGGQKITMVWKTNHSIHFKLGVDTYGIICQK